MSGIRFTACCPRFLGQWDFCNITAQLRNELNGEKQIVCSASSSSSIPSIAGKMHMLGVLVVLVKSCGRPALGTR